MLLDDTFLRKLNNLRLVTRRVRAGQRAGERRSTRRGSSVEFADYRDYVRGDDLRRVDWNIYARLERPYVKLFEEEEDLAVHILLDGSGSMDWGTGEENKWLCARRLAAALGYVALMEGDPLTVCVIRHPQPATWGPLRGRGHILKLFAWLETSPAEGTTDLNRTLQAYALAGGRAGLAILISDMFSPTGFTAGLTRLAASGYELTLIHVLSPDEINPPLGGDLRLLDVEKGDPEDVTIDTGVLMLYRQRLKTWREDIRAACRARDVRYISVATDTPLERIILYELRRSGLVRG
ncbi:MAG: DUF58 domain-containing protein [Anaerolineae bacterium]|nr:DUF58 domain-containing protein [Anaerolineae bacterium]